MELWLLPWRILPYIFIAGWFGVLSLSQTSLLMMFRLRKSKAQNRVECAESIAIFITSGIAPEGHPRR
jgi:hypothetical protein